MAYNERDFQTALVCGLMSKGRELKGERKPIADLYNGANYITFASADPFTIGVYNATKNWDGMLEYSTDLANWIEWDGTTAISSSEHESEQRIYMRGSGNTVITGNSTFNSTTHKYDGKYSFALTGSNISCSGNLETLLDYEAVARGEHPVMATYCFMGLFNECASLISAPELPAPVLSTSCYAYMFCRCTGLTSTPKLPATALAYRCYYYMFFACSKLTKATALPATTLQNSCYNHMFSSCSRLETLPALPARTLVTGCYNDMFSDCTKIKIATTESEEYNTPYRIPIDGEGTGSGASCMYAMFWYTASGTKFSFLDLNKTYYTANEVLYPPEEPEPSEHTDTLIGYLLGNGLKAQR